MEENLLGHLLKANDAPTQADVDRSLANDPRARQMLQDLEGVFAPLAADQDEFEPPSDLFVRTLARVAEHIVYVEGPAPRPRSSVETIFGRSKLPQPTIVPSESNPVPLTPKARTWLAPVGLTLAALALVLPAIVHLRQQSQQIACQNNLRQFHQGLVGYSETNDNKFPQVKTGEQVLTVGRVMERSGYLPPEVMNCPVQVADANAAPLVLAGYAYSLGYREGDELRGLSRDTQNEFLPILADAPRRRGIDAVPVNHRHGQNVLFVGGNVRFCTTATVGVQGDNIFCNSKDEVGAGLTKWDSVLGRAEETP